MQLSVRKNALELLCELALAKDPGLKVSEDSHLEQDLGFDSLERLNLMFKFRERYGVTITAEDYIDRKLAIVKNLLDYIAASTG